MVSGQSARPLPVGLLLLLLVFIVVRITSAAQREPWRAEAADLSAASSGLLTIVGGGDPLPVARVTTLWLQAFDNQPGISLSYRELDYPIVTGWLDEIVRLDSRGQYPLLLASRLYGEVNQPSKQRLMADWVFQQYRLNPAQNWRWLTHWVTLARHQLDDLPLALTYANALAQADGDFGVPGWARQMEVLLLDDMGEHQSAAIMLGGLLDSGVVTDPAEQRFLLQRLVELQDRLEGQSGLVMTK